MPESLGWPISSTRVGSLEWPRLLAGENLDDDGGGAGAEYKKAMPAEAGIAGFWRSYVKLA